MSAKHTTQPHEDPANAETVSGYGPCPIARQMIDYLAEREDRELVIGCPDAAKDTLIFSLVNKSGGAGGTPISSRMEINKNMVDNDTFESTQKLLVRYIRKQEIQK